MSIQAIPDGGHNRLRDKAYAPFFGFGLQRPAWGGAMMAGSDGAAVAGGAARHVPVLARAAPVRLHLRDGGIYIDGTFGAGGYTRAILSAADAQVIAIDRDQG